MTEQKTNPSSAYNVSSGDRDPEKKNQTANPRMRVKMWVALGFVLVIGLAAGAYFMLDESSLFTKTPAPANTNHAAALNVNGKVICASTTDCPKGYSCASVDNAVTGKVDHFCVSDTAFADSGTLPLNTNILPANTNGNSNQNQNVNVDLTPINVSDWKAVTYQRADHGFTLEIPSDWQSSTYSSGMREGENMLNAYMLPTSSDTGYLSMSVQFYSLTGQTLSEWVTAHMPSLKHSNEELSKKNSTMGAQPAVRVTSTQPPDSTSGTPGYRTEYGYVAKGDRVYEVSVNGTEDARVRYEAAVTKMIGSFTFTETLPIVRIPEISANQKIEASQGYAIQVKWLAKHETLNLIDPALTSTASGVVQRAYYKVGDIQNGRYQGQSFILIFETPEGPAFTDNLYRAVYDPTAKTLVYLEKYSDNLSYFQFKFAYDTASTVPDLVLPATIAIPNSQVTLRETLYNPNKLFSSFSKLTTLFTDSTVGPVYYNPTQKCFAIKTPDLVIKHYHLLLPWASNFKEGEYAMDSSRFVPNIAWDDTTAATDEYTFNEPSSCGTSNCHAIYTDEEIDAANALVVTGTTADGDKIYEYKDPNNKVLKEVYDMYYVPQSETKLSYDKFTKSHPVFYWKDPFDQWIRFKKVKFFPAVECGKPVIYLYPKVTTSVNVQVKPNGGFSVTEPVYPTGGWQVVAQPNGRLTDANGTAYPYLFWEGLGLNYERPKAGFVVSVAQVKTLLEEKLALLGLNDKESAEFMDFWLPRLQAAPYYFITFVDQAVFDQLAPLTVSPRPDQVIRVFMDYQPLLKPISVPPLAIKTPLRHGFTVVEWGGALNR